MPCFLDVLFCVLLNWILRLLICISLRNIPTLPVPNAPTNCVTIIIYNQLLLFINSTWYTVPVSTSCMYIYHDCMQSFLGFSRKTQDSPSSSKEATDGAFQSWPALREFLWSGGPGIAFRYWIHIQPGSSGPMPRCKWRCQPVPDQFPGWVFCGYWECEHCQLHS